MKCSSVVCALLLATALGGCGQQLPPETHADAVTAAWMRPDATKKALLYVSDAYDSLVDVYDFKSRQLVGTLTGFSDPGPQCVDRKGDVYVVNFGTATTLEFKRGGTSAINTFANGSDDAVGCTVDAAGDLAITSQDPGQILVYAGGAHSGVTYSDSACEFMWPAGYDGAGNLYAEGHGTAGVVVCELPAGATQMRQVSLSGVPYINFPGSIQWDGKYLTLTDQKYLSSYNTALYQTTESNSGNLTVVGTTELTASCNYGYTEVLEPYIVGSTNEPVAHKQGKTLVGGNAQCSDAGVGYWPYPKGGAPKRTFGDYDASGVSVSFK